MTEYYQKTPISACTTIKQDAIGRTQKIADLLKYALITRYIKTDRKIPPLSVILIAESELNKTRLLLAFKNIHHAKTIENLSPKPLSNFLKEQDKKQTFSHLIILDFIRTLQTSSQVAFALSTVLNNLMDEGTQCSMYYGQEYDLKQRIQMGILTGITPQIFRKHFARWNENGLITRFLPVSYQYSEDTNQEVLTYISQDIPYVVKEATTTWKKRGYQTINIDNPDIQSAIKLLTEDLVNHLKTFYVTKYYGRHETKVYLNMHGFRLLRMIQLLAKTICYERGDNIVNYQDLAKLKEVCDLVRFPDNPKEV